VIASIDTLSTPKRAILVTASVTASEGKKTHVGTMIPSLAAESNPAAVAESPEAPNLMPATAKKTSDIVMNCRVYFCGGTQKLRCYVYPATY
jgi:hypothetical protein